MNTNCEESLELLIDEEVLEGWMLKKMSGFSIEWLIKSFINDELQDIMNSFWAIDNLDIL